VKALVKQLLKKTHDWSDVRNFIPFEKTIKAARAAGLSVGDYTDGVMNRTPGMTQRTIDQIAELGVFGDVNAALEIGPGTGRYLEKVLKRCTPKRYEIYETAREWEAYVVRQFGVTACPSDGRTLSSTPSGSIDLAQAYKVFSTIPFIASVHYFSELVRIVRPGGYCVFDVMTEKCLDLETLDRWVASKIDNGSWPAAMPRSAVVNYFESRDFALVGSFIDPMPPGKTETLVFRRAVTPAINA
jgi:hypothetical protein